MAVQSLSSQQLRLEIDAESGRWKGLFGGRSERSWLHPSPDAEVGLPFVQGSGLHRGEKIALVYEADADGSLKGRSVRGETEARLSASERHLTAELTLPDRRGPRSGWCLDLDHLDLPGFSRAESVMPVMIATSPQLDWAYLVWQRGEDDLLVVCVDGPFAAWRIDYSYAGHKMTGFEVLARADDVICPPERFPAGRLPTVTALKVHFAWAGSRQVALETAREILGLAVLVPSMSGGILGSRVDFAAEGSIAQVEHEAPDGATQVLSAVPESWRLDAAGQHHFRVTAASGRVHETVLYAVPEWQEFADRAIRFHREHYQLPIGAFARVVREDTLKPDGRNFGSDHFGNPEEQGSCRTGEFGGFAAWAQLLHQLHFNPDPDTGAEPDPELETSIQRYFDWMLNRGRPDDDPMPGTVSWLPHTAGGIERSTGHFFHEINYAQHEAWLIGQLAEGAATEEDYQQLRLLCQHYLKDHVDDDGVIWNQNFDHEAPVDYSTVDCPAVHLLGAASALRTTDADLADRLLDVCNRQAKHLLKRGFHFPTEGEACTEDGSIACQAWGLARLYNDFLEDKDWSWIEMAEALMDFHAKLEFSGTDVRLHGSTDRFWETQYETDHYGASINAGHGWTLWSALARLELFEATGKFAHLAKAWEHTLCAASTFRADGGSWPCWTPDLIPGVPHDDAWGKPDKKAEGRTTSVPLAWGYPNCLSMSGMHLFIVAPRIWYTTCGVDLETGQVINARLEGNRLIPSTPACCKALAIRGLLPEHGELVLDKPYGALSVYLEDVKGSPEFGGAKSVAEPRKGQSDWLIMMPDGSATLGISVRSE